MQDTVNERLMGRRIWSID